MKCSKRTVRAMLATAMIAFASLARAGEVFLQPNLSYEWYQPSVGIGFDTLTQSDAYFIYDGLKYSSFTFSDLSGIGAIATSELFMLFSAPSGEWQPKVVTYPSVRTPGQHLQYQLGWTVTNLTDGKSLSSARIGMTEAGVGLEGLPGSVRIDESVFDSHGQLLGTNAVRLSYDGTYESIRSSIYVSELAFAPTASIARSFFIDISNGYSDGFGATVGGSASPVAAPIPEPETYAMMLAGLGLLSVVARRRTQKPGA